MYDGVSYIGSRKGCSRMEEEGRYGEKMEK